MEVIVKSMPFSLIETVYYIAATVGVIGALVMLAIAFRQLKLTRKQLHGLTKQLNSSTLLKIYDEMKDLRPYWHELFSLYKERPDYKTWTSDDKKVADRLCVDLEKIAFLAVKGFVDERFLIEEYASVYARCWYRMSAYVKQHRMNRGEPAELRDGGRQRENFEKIALKAQAYLDGRKIKYDDSVD